MRNLPGSTSESLVPYCFRGADDLGNTSKPYYYSCYFMKEDLPLCGSTNVIIIEKEMPHLVDLGDESDNENAVGTGSHDIRTVKYQWYSDKPLEVTSLNLSGCVDKVDARVTILRAQSLGVKAVIYGGDSHKLVMR